MMTIHTSRSGRRGFTLIELLIVIAIITLLIAILLPALKDSRRSARTLICQSNFKQFGIAISNYATDFTDRIASFTWRANEQNAPWVPPTTSQTQAAADQAVDILRRRGDRELGADAINQITGWIPNVLYTHLVLNDYLAQRLPEPMVACPEDRLRLQWQINVRQYKSLWWQTISEAERPGGAAVDNSEQRWPYSASYNFVPAAWAPDQRIRRGTAFIDTVSQTGLDHNMFNVPVPVAANAKENFYGSRKLSDVDFPSMKISMYDSYNRHFAGRKVPLFFMYPECKQPVLMFDTSVRITKTEQTNKGFQPNNPLGGPSLITYRPDTWEYRTRSGAASEGVTGYYRWTRAGLRGVDVLGNEILGKAP